MNSNRELIPQDAFLYIFRHRQRFREVVEGLCKGVYEAYSYYDAFQMDPEDWTEKAQKTFEGIWKEVADNKERLLTLMEAPLVAMLRTLEGCDSWRDGLEKALLDIKAYRRDRRPPESP